MSETGKPERRPTRAAFAIAAGLAAIGALLIRESYVIPNKAGYAGVGSGDAPWLIGICLVLLAVATVGEGARGDIAPPPPQRLAPVAWIVGGALIQLVFVPILGFTLATGALFACAAAGFGEKRFHLSLRFGLGLSFAVYLIFGRLLQLSLPDGPLERLVFGG